MVGIKFGCLSYVILIVEVICVDGLELVGWIVNWINLGIEYYVEIIEYLEGWFGILKLGEIFYMFKVKC